MLPLAPRNSCPRTSSTSYEGDGERFAELLLPFGEDALLAAFLPSAAALCRVLLPLPPLLLVFVVRDDVRFAGAIAASLVG